MSELELMILLILGSIAATTWVTNQHIDERLDELERHIKELTKDKP